MALPGTLNDRWFQAFTLDAGSNPALNVVLAGGTVAGALTFPDGTQVAPSIAFTSETGLGFRRVGAGIIGLQANANNPELRILNAGSTVLNLTTTEDTATAVTNVNGTGFWTSGSTGYALGGLNGNRSAIRYLTESTTLAGATTDTTIQFPANSLCMGVSIRITTTVTGCTTINLGTAASATLFASGILLPSGTTATSCGTTNPSIFSSATSMRFTAVGGAASFSAGVVRSTLFFFVPSAPTS